MTTVAVVPWAPASFEEGVGLAVVSLACWGTWSNTAKDTSRLLNDFYHDFSVGLLCLSILAYCTLGRAVFSAESGQLGVAKVCAAFSAGGLFNLANILLIESMMLVGISVAIPIGTQQSWTTRISMIRTPSTLNFAVRPTTTYQA